MTDVSYAGLALIGAAGASVGSFTSTAVMRRRRSEQALFGRSRCDGCGRSLKLWEATPIAAFLAFKGRCRTCGNRISPDHFWSEVVGAALALAIATSAVFRGEAPEVCTLHAAIGFLLLALSLFDLQTLTLPNALNLALLVCAAALSFCGGTDVFLSGVLSALIVFFGLQGIRRLYYGLRHRHGLGAGDIKLLSALSVWLGPAIFATLALASTLALAWSLFGPKVSTRLPFGPFIAVSAVLIGFSGVASMVLG